jgi:AraC-like DNA-binding protein
MSNKGNLGAETVAFWREEGPEGVELLRGEYSDFRFAPHSHDRYLFALITRGALNIFDPHRSVVASAGQVVLYNYDQVHWGHTASKQGWAILSMYVAPNVLHAISEEMGSPPCDTIGLPNVVVTDPALSGLFTALNTELDGGLHSRVCQSRVSEIIRYILARHAEPQVQLPPARRESRAALQAREFIKENYFTDVSLEQLAEICGVSRHWLVKVFKAAFGIPPYAFLLDVRVRQAACLLREGQDIADVAHQCGFSDQSHLTRMLKRALAITPGRFQEHVH